MGKANTFQDPSILEVFPKNNRDWLEPRLCSTDHSPFGGFAVNLPHQNGSTTPTIFNPA